MDDLYNQIEQARAAIAARVSVTPRVALILGSGLGSLADELEDATVVPYAEVPGFPQSTVHGHRGELGVRAAGRPAGGGDARALSFLRRLHHAAGHLPGARAARAGL